MNEETYIKYCKTVTSIFEYGMISNLTNPVDMIINCDRDLGIDDELCAIILVNFYADSNHGIPKDADEVISWTERQYDEEDGYKYYFNNLHDLINEVIFTGRYKTNG